MNDTKWKIKLAETQIKQLKMDMDELELENIIIEQEEDIKKHKTNKGGEETTQQEQKAGKKEFIKNRLKKILLEKSPNVLGSNEVKHRIFCDQVKVKYLPPGDKKSSLRTHEEQYFKIDKYTTFKDLLRTSSSFWGWKNKDDIVNDFSLYSKNFEHIMGLNHDKAHPSHYVAKYFETLKIHEPILHLYASKDAQSHINKYNEEKLMKQQYEASQIPNYNNLWSMARHKINQQTKVEQEKILIKSENKEKFDKAFPGIQQYNMAKPNEDKEVVTTAIRKKLDPDVFLPTFIVNLILCATTLVTILYGHSFTTEYFMISNQENMFLEDKYIVQDQYYQEIDTIQLFPFNQVRKYDQFEHYMKNTIALKIFPECKENECKNDAAGSLAIGTLVIKTQHHNTCSDENTDKTTCTKTDDIILGKQQQGAFFPMDDNNRIPHISYKKFSYITYVSSYFDKLDSFEFQISRDTDKTEFRDILEKLMKDGRFFDKKTIEGCEIEFTNYIPATDMYLSTKLVFQFLPSGLVKPKLAQVLPLKPNTKSTNIEVVMMIAYIIRLIFCIWTLVTIYIKVKFSTVLGNQVPSILRDMMQLFLSVMPVLIFWVGFPRDPIKYLDPYHPIQKNNDHFRVAKTQRLSLYMDGVCIQFLFFKLIMSFKKITFFDWIFSAIGRTLITLFYALIILASLLLVCTLQLWFLYGPSMKRIEALPECIFTVFRFLLGINDTGAFIKAGPSLFLGWSFVTTIIYFYLILPIMIAILLDSFDKVTKEQGHVTDQISTGWESILEWHNERPYAELIIFRDKLKKKKERLALRTK